MDGGRKGSHLKGAARKKFAAKLRKNYDSGASIRALAEETGRSFALVRQLLEEAGTAIRGHGGARSETVRARKTGAGAA
ncbi:helix-turn-helix domain-containing protein [Kitasatospora sp. NPDC056783]|uniref:helix-turn-helix domain-containing protein n=1 Tax=Kitasatospora sp. NPDC056783 TaxID=3345943 RepID=UPI0036CAB607